MPQTSQRGLNRPSNAASAFRLIVTQRPIVALFAGLAMAVSGLSGCEERVLPPTMPYDQQGVSKIRDELGLEETDDASQTDAEAVKSADDE